MTPHRQPFEKAFRTKRLSRDVFRLIIAALIILNYIMFLSLYLRGNNLSLPSLPKSMIISYIFSLYVCLISPSLYACIFFVSFLILMCENERLRSYFCTYTRWHTAGLISWSSVCTVFHFILSGNIIFVWPGKSTEAL